MTQVHVEYAQLPPPEDSADRIFITDNAVIVLDGATAFVPVPVSAQTYADDLGRRLADQLHTCPDLDLCEALARAIRQTTENLGLRTSESPSSAVSILRERTTEYDVLLLGDTGVFWGSNCETSRLIDDRLSHVGASQRSEYRSRLREGNGFDDHHRESLRALQTEQRKYRNVDGGYWIAETDPAAAYNALVTTIPRAQLAWAVLATDGAADLVEHQGRTAWAEISHYTSTELDDLLLELFRWEEEQDAVGRQLPRAKLHDDKTLASVTTKARDRSGHGS